jgi:hypothetical protein
LSLLEEEPILRARRETSLGPGRLAGIARRARSTIWKVLWRHGVSRRPRGERQSYRRYEWSRPGALLHMDVKKLARFSAPVIARREAADVTDRGHEGRGRLHVDAGDGHQPQHLGPRERLLGDLALQGGDFDVEEVDLPQAPVQGEPLVVRQLECRKPAAAALAERVGDRRSVAEVARQHTVRLVLRAGAGPDEPLAPVRQPPQRPRPLIRRPDLIEQP